MLQSGIFKGYVICGAVMLLMAGCKTMESRSDENVDIFKKPSTNPTLTGFYTEALDSIHTEMIEENGKTCVFFIDSMTGFVFSPFLMQGNLLLGGAIPVTKNFAIPASFAVVYNYADEPYGNHSYNTTYGVIGTGGLIFHGKYGVFAGYAGYSWEQRSEFYPAYDIDSDSSEGNVQWAVYPVINAKEYPLLQSFLKIIDGFYSMDNLKMNRDEFKPNYKANVVFRRIPLFHSGWDMSLSAYTQKNWYDFMAKYNLYAGKIDFVYSDFYWCDYFAVTLESGYRDFFDVKQTKNIYENGAFIRIASKLAFEKSGVMIFLESGSMSLLKKPIFGILGTVPFENFNILFVSGKDKSVDMGLKFHMYR